MSNVQLGICGIILVTCLICITVLAAKHIVDPETVLHLLSVIVGGILVYITPTQKKAS